ncbi:MAG: DUF4331 domain-containing protein [Gemmataceae bacterium]|nr:DUF4331 domain-containing protein [Gemmataceae bacterium]
MRNSCVSPRLRVALLGAGALAGILAVVLTTVTAPAADHRDGPIFANTVTPTSDNDINDLYIFQSPTNPSNTVLVVTWSPFTGSLTPTTFDPKPFFDLRLDNTGDAVDDLIFRVTFGPEEAGGEQRVTVRGLPAVKFPGGGILAKGLVAQNLPLAGGGLFRADVFDDPFFFDAAATGAFLTAGTAPLPRATPRNFFANANTLAYVIEIPTARLLSAPGNPRITGFIRFEQNNVVIDRMGQPAINTGLIPPVPRSDLTRGDRRNAFNAGLPRNDRRDFLFDAMYVLGVNPDGTPNPRSLFKRSAADARTVAEILLPDVLKYDTTRPADYSQFNGRTLRDDVIDVTLRALTGSPTATDGVPDDNATITDGRPGPNGVTLPVAFPYLGPRNRPDGLPNP